MCRNLTIVAAALLLATIGATTAEAEKSGGILRIPFVTSPASMSIHGESTIAALGSSPSPASGCAFFLSSGQPRIDEARKTVTAARAVALIG